MPATKLLSSVVAPWIVTSGVCFAAGVFVSCVFELFCSRSSMLETLQLIPQPGTAWKSWQEPRVSVPNSYRETDLETFFNLQEHFHQTDMETDVGGKQIFP